MLRRTQLNLANDPILSKNEKHNTAKFLAYQLFKIFCALFLLWHFLVLGKTYNNQNQEGFTIS